MTEDTKDQDIQEQAEPAVKPKRRSRPQHSRKRTPTARKKTAVSPDTPVEESTASLTTGPTPTADSPSDHTPDQSESSAQDKNDAKAMDGIESTISRIVQALNKKKDAGKGRAKPSAAVADQAAPATEGTAEAGETLPEAVRKAPAKRKRTRSGRGKAKQETASVPESSSASDALAPSLASAALPPSDRASEEAERPDTTLATEEKPDSAPRQGARKREKARPSRKPATKQPMAAKDEEEATPAEEPARSVKRVLLINSEEPEECRIALLEDNKVEDFHVETVGRTQTKGNIYKGRIVAVEANLQAAFVEIGTEKNGFLPFSDIHPEYYYKDVPSDASWKDLKIQDYIRKGEEVLVEVVKEVSGTKGAGLTTYLSLAGRYLVLMPGSDSHGISRKLDEDEREKLRKMIDGFNLPEGVGYIVRTASKNVTKTSLSKDIKYLLNLWQEIKEAGQTKPVPSLLYKDQDIIARFLRDHYTPDIDEIVVDSDEAFKQVFAFLDLIQEKQNTTRVRLHIGSRPLFDHFKVEEQIEQIFQSRVLLPSGGSIVINQTEALVAIDVNSGRTSKDKDFEESIFLANMEAAEELARQLRLRDLGGLIVIDFIDMRSLKHTRDVEKKIKTSMKRDKAKYDITRISCFGLMQISRQRLGPPVEQGSYYLCPHCQGRGSIPSVETQALTWLRRIQNGAGRRHVSRVECTLPMEVAHYLMNKKRGDLARLEERHGFEITIKGEPGMPISSSSIEFVKKE